MGLLPTYIEGDVSLTSKVNPVIPKEYEVDFETGQLTGRIVEGKEAIKVWIWFALQTPRYRYYIYSWDYGSEFEELIGQRYTEEYIDTEVRRMTEDCLLVNKNIQSLTDFSVNMEDCCLTMSFTANTIYGDVKVENEKIKVV